MDALLTTFHEDFVGFQWLSRLASIIARLAGESDLDRVFVLQTNDIFAAPTNQRRMILVGDLENFGGLISLSEG